VAISKLLKAASARNRGVAADHANLGQQWVTARGISATASVDMSSGPAAASGILTHPLNRAIPTAMAGPRKPGKRIGSCVLVAKAMLVARTLLVPAAAPGFGSRHNCKRSSASGRPALAGNRRSGVPANASAAFGERASLEHAARGCGM
jgi:hypothetical protein